MTPSAGRPTPRHRHGGDLLAGLLLVGALLSLWGVAVLVPLPWSILVAVLLITAELAFYRRLRAERDEDNPLP